VTLWILDTNVINQLHGYAPNIEKKLAGVNPSDVAITIITAEELISGWFNEINKANNQNKLSNLIHSYRGLSTTLAYLKEVRVLEFDQKAYEIYLQLRQQVKMKRTGDIRIAAIALSVNGIVVTRNHKDFAKVPNLKIEDWTVAS
jgi:tRNA(fMet)-specific endonuclease VapC